MNTQAKFCDRLSEPPPFNRRVYKAAKFPFAFAWKLVLLAVNIACDGVGWIVFFGVCFAVLALLGVFPS